MLNCFVELCRAKESISLDPTERETRNFERFKCCIHFQVMSSQPELLCILCTQCEQRKRKYRISYHCWKKNLLDSSLQLNRMCMLYFFNVFDGASWTKCNFLFIDMRKPSNERREQNQMAAETGRFVLLISNRFFHHRMKCHVIDFRSNFTA